MEGQCPVFWKRALVHIDIDAFYASVEQRDFPRLRGRPVAVTNGEVGTCIITCSYEARAHGIKTGMRLREARRHCPDLIQRPARPQAYAAISTVIMQTLQDITPEVEIFSVDEAFLDVTGCQRLYGTPARMARLAKDKVREISGLSCSVGVSGDKTTAKFAAKLNKPDGFTVIPPWAAGARLAQEPVTALSGIAEGVGKFLAAYGVYRCGDVGQLPVSVLARRFGNIGRHIWLMCQGRDPSKVQLEVPPPKSLGHGKILPPNTRDRAVLLTFLLHMSEKVAARLRRHDLQAKQFFIGLRLNSGFWIGDTLKLAQPKGDGKAIYELCCWVLDKQWNGDPINQVQITALDPQPCGQQLNLFAQHDEGIQQRNRVMDEINRRYGEFALAPARLLRRSTMPNVITPAWRPSGPRQNI